MSEIPQPERFFLEVAPYAAFAIGSGEFVDVMRVEFFRGTLDTYCVECGKEGVFQSMAPSLFVPTGPRTRNAGDRVTVDDLIGDKLQAYWPASGPLCGPTGPLLLSQMKPLALKQRVFQVAFSCTRNPEHLLYFFFRVQDDAISKIGQSPSLADLHLAAVKKYRKLLGEEKYREFTRAIGLHAHGVGIGAFVYLRRIFENLITTARDAAAREEGWDGTAFAGARMDEKIRLLQGKLPAFLVQNRSIYSILSRGLHELSEEQCLEMFEPVKVGIELILDEKLEQQERAAKIASTTKVLAKIKGELDGD